MILNQEFNNNWKNLVKIFSNFHKKEKKKDCKMLNKSKISRINMMINFKSKIKRISERCKKKLIKILQF